MKVEGRNLQKTSIDEEENIFIAKESWDKKGEVEHKKRTRLFNPPESVP